MSWEDIKKRKEEREKERQKQAKVNSQKNTTKTNNQTAQKNTTIWDQVKSIASNTGRIGENTLLGGKVGVMDSLNFTQKTADTNMGKHNYLYKVNKDKDKVLNSTELTDEEKKAYLTTNKVSRKNKDIVSYKSNNNIANNFKPATSSNVDFDKIEKVVNENVLDKSIKEDETKIQENIEKQTGTVSKKLAELAPSIGNMAVGTAISALNPVSGATYFSMSASGSYYRDAKARGMTDEEALNYGAIMGAMEGATEAIGIENFSKAGKTLKTVIKGAGKEVVKEGTEQIGKATVKQALKQYGIGIADNVMQESLIEPIQEITAGAIGGKDKADFSNMGSRMLQAGINGGLTSAIVGGANLGVSSCTGVIEKARNGQQVTQEEMQTAVKDASKELDVQKMIVDSTQQQVNKYKNNTQDLQQNTTIEQNNTLNQQVNQENNKVAQNGMSDLLNNDKLPMQSYQYEKNDNAKINNLRQDASKYFNNTEKAHNYISMLEKIIQDKDIDIRFDQNLTNSEGKVANGSYSNGVITINPNSNSTGEFIAIHELTHAVGTQQMIDMVENYRKSNSEFNSAVETLLKNYNQSEITEESLADVSAQLFGNQEFINNLSQSNPNIFQKIYSEIKYLWHQFRGYKNQDQFVEDLYYKWTQAYNSNNKLNESTNYSIQQNNNGKYIKVDTDQDIFNGIEEKDYNKIAKMYMQDYLKGNAKLSKSDNATIGSKGINKYTNPKQQTKYMNEKMKLTPELKNVLEIAEKVQDSPPTKDTSKYPNWEYYKFNFELGGKNFEGLINIGIDKNGNKHFYEINKIHTTSNSYVSTNKSSSTDLTNNSILPTQENVNSATKYSIQESENNSGSFKLPENISNKDFEKYILTDIQEMYKNEDNTEIKETIEELQEQKEKIDINTDEGWDKNFEINQKIKALKNGQKSVYDNLVNEEVQRQLSNSDNLLRTISEAKQKELKQEKLNKEIEEATPFKRAQYEIIQKTNPMFDDEHVGIRSPADIVTFEEAIQNAENDGTFEWGDYSKENAQKDLKRNKVRIYSSYAIKNGVFVSTSYQQALEYAGGDRSKVHSKEVNPNRVAWINGDEGQYASVTKLPTGEKYSLPTKEWQEYLDENYKPTGTRTNFEDIKLPTKKQSTPPQRQDIESNNIDNDTKPTYNTVSANLPLSENTKVRKHYKSIIESSYINDDARKISRELMGTDTYVPESNDKQLERANKRIETAIEMNGRAGVDSELNSLMTRAMTKGNIKADDIAVGERLIQYYSKIGDKAKLQDAIQATAMAGTTAGQTVQAMSLLNHQTPEGQAVWLQRSVDKMNNELKEQRGTKNKEAEQFTLTQDMLDKITSSKDDAELQENLNQVYSELGQQVSKTTMGKIDSWRYFSMLANPKTHIRNTVGNVAMGVTQTAKNKLAGVIEGIASKINPNMERTHTIVPASTEVKEFAKNDIVNVADRLGLSQNKYNPKNRIESNMRTFKSDIMENTLGKLFDLNDKALEAEDGWGLKAGYKKALSEYMTANKLTPENITDKQLAKARNYAVEQAKEATFHQECQLASLVNQLSNKNKFAKATADAILPFVKTPMNVAKAGASYSPVGLAKSMVYDTVQLRKGNINVNQYMDNISKGLTGTGIALVGYALAKSGILKASGSDDDKKEEYEENQGKQTYAIQIGDNTYSLDWLSPTGIPLFIGAEIWEMNLNKEKDSASSTDEDSRYNQILNSGTNLLNAMANAMNPMTEMSMLSGLTSALQSYEQGSAKMLASMATNAGKSYVNQFVPTALGQVAKTTDKYERNTSSTKQGVLSRAVDSTKNQIMSKIPGLRQKLPTKTDIWGNDLKQADNVVQRALENAVVPYTRKSVSTNAVDKELTRLYDETGESSVLPGVLDKSITIDGEKYRFTADEYADYKKQFGQESFKMFSNVVRSTSYKNMSDEKKQEVIENIYTYNKELIKKDYADKNNKEFEESTMMKTINDIQKNKGNVANYFIYEADIKDMKADKDEDGDSVNGSLSAKKAYYIMNNKNFSTADKNAFLKNMTSSENYETVEDLKKLDNKESIYKYYFKLTKESKESFKSAIKVIKNQSEYVKFKQQEFKADKKNDGTVNGKSITGSKKKKVYDYVNNSNASYTDRLYMIGTEYELNKSEKSTLMNYINSLNITSTEKYNIIKTLKGSTEYKDGSIRY